MSLCDAPGSQHAPVIDEFGERKALLCFPYQAKLVIAKTKREGARLRGSGFKLLPLGRGWGGAYKLCDIWVTCVA